MKQFAPVNSDDLLGEASPFNLPDSLAANTIKETIPNCKIIIILRNPVDRAYSNYLHWNRIGRDDQTFEESIKIASFLENAYHKLGYRIVNVPFGTIDQRGISEIDRSFISHHIVLRIDDLNVQFLFAFLG